MLLFAICLPVNANGQANSAARIGPKPSARTIEIEQWKFPDFFAVTTGDHHRSHDMDAIAQLPAREREQFFKSAQALKAEAA